MGLIENAIRAARIALIGGLIAAMYCATAAAQRPPPPMSERASEPFQIFDNLYFVGTNEVASYVISTSEGLILADTLYGGEYTPYLVSNMQQLGLDIADVEYILIMQGHWDHYGGARVLQDQHTDAPVGALAEDWQMIDADIGDAAPQRRFVIADGDSLTLGDTTLHFEHTPGHTPGTLSIRLPVYDNGTEYQAYYHGSTAIRTDEPAAVRRYIADLERIKAIPGIDVHIVTHFDAYASGTDDLFGRAARLAARQPGDPHPWVSREEFHLLLDQVIAESRAILP